MIENDKTEKIKFWILLIILGLSVALFFYLSYTNEKLFIG